MTQTELLNTIRAEIERLKEINKRLLGGQLREGCLYAFNQVLAFLDTLPEQPELVQHPAISYMYDADADRDEQLRQALLALLKSDLIQVAGRGFKKQDLIGWVEKK